MSKNSFFTLKPIIGAVHFMPLPGIKGHEGFERTLEKAKRDTEAFINGGVDALIFENNYDYPHTIAVSAMVETAMIDLIKAISPQILFGISVLWNDYKAALRIAKKTGGKFIRIPVFVDRVKTQYGIVEPTAKDVIEYREEIGAEETLLFTDIHVKHAELLSTMTLLESAQKAIESGSDGLIITGRWTGEAPELEDLKKLRSVVGDFPLIIGSGADKDNIGQLMEDANGVIVSTSVKTGEDDKQNVNMKSYYEIISEAKVQKFVLNAKGDM